MKKRKILLVLAALLLGACGAIWVPTNRTNQQNTTAISLSGYSLDSADAITFTAYNRNTGSSETIGTADGGTSYFTSSGYSIYQWSASLTPAAQYWAPQSVMVGGTWTQPNGLATSIGRLELAANDTDGQPFYTFSASAESCAKTEVDGGTDYVSAAESCQDGQSLVVFDTDGVGVGPMSTTWTPKCCGSGNCTTPSTPCNYQDSSVSGIKWQLGTYQSQTLPGSSSAYSIHAMVCEPLSGSPTKAMIINHGGYVLDNASLEFCQWGATMGYVTAMTSYRGEPIVLGPNPPYGTKTNPITNAPVDWWSQGNIEICLGEVIDAMQLTSVIEANWGISSNNVVMWGHSHGACVTERAVEAGLPLRAAAAFDAPTNMYNWYQYCPPASTGVPESQCDLYSPGNAARIAQWFGYPASLPPNPPANPIVPVESRIPYDWRSPASWASDLGARKDVHMLLLQGNADALIEPAQACQLAQGAWGTNSLNYHLSTAHVGLSTAPGGVETNTYYDTLGNPVPTGCASYTSLAWITGSPPSTSWSTTQNYLLVYDGLNHGTVLPASPFSPPSGSPFQDFINWLAAM